MSIVGKAARRNSAHIFRATLVLNFVVSRIKFEDVRAGQLLIAIADQPAEFGIHFRNQAIEMANADSNSGRLKHGLEAQMAIIIIIIIIAHRRKLTNDVHINTTPSLELPLELRQLDSPYLHLKHSRQVLFGRNIEIPSWEKQCVFSANE